MDHSNAPSYGLWSLVVINSLVFMFGFLLQWPTLVTLSMFPILVVVYSRLARTEERWALQEFGDEYRRYRARTPAFIPHLGRASGEANFTNT